MNVVGLRNMERRGADWWALSLPRKGQLNFQSPPKSTAGLTVMPPSFAVLRMAGPTRSITSPWPLFLYLGGGAVKAA